MKNHLPTPILPMSKPPSHSQQGFTLIELMVVIIVMGILSAMALPMFLKQSNKAREAEAKTYVGAINRGQQAYFLENNAFSGLNNLMLGLPSGTNNYTYASIPSGSGMTAAVDTTATPVGVTMRGFAGRVWLGVLSDGTATSFSLVCEGAANSIPTITGTVCPP